MANIAIEQFDELEIRIVRTVELVKTTQKELAAARVEVGRLQREIDELKRERELVKNKVEFLLDTLSSLTEEPSVQSEAASNRR
jgi:chromosome segregation ATPase